MKVENGLEQQHRRLLGKLFGVVVVMFVFAVFAMPPIYDAFCELTGLNGKGRMQAAKGPLPRVDEGRALRVEFLTATDAGLPWRFRQGESRINVHPGQINQVMFRVENEAAYAVVGRAVPSIAPAEAAQYIKKTECFCFREQRLEAKAARDMPMIFYVDPEIPAHIRTVTLSYKFYLLPGKQQDQLAAR